MKKGFQFNVMVVGQSGLGKSTLVNTIFASHLIESKGRLAADETTRQTTEIEAVSHSKKKKVYTHMNRILNSSVFLKKKAIEENGVRLRLNIVDTPGYGDQVNNDNW